MSATDQKVDSIFAAGFAAPKSQRVLTSFHKPLPGMAAELPMEPYSASSRKITK